jgi:hypothetical protein
MRAKAILAAIAAASGSVLALTHVGANPVAPGADLGVVVTINDATDAIVVRSDAKDLTAFIRLTMSPPTSDTYAAQLENGTNLGATAQPGSRSSVLTIHKAAMGATEKFDWPSGVNVKISRTQPVGSSAKVQIVDWEVFSKDDQSDAKWKAVRRKIWWWTSTILLLLTGAAAVLADGKEGKKKGHAITDLVATVIDEIEGENPEETKHIRTFLRKRVLEGAAHEEALDATGLKPAKARAVSVKARNYFPARLRELILDLQRIADEHG